jgi:hypothetical protein
VFAGGQKMGPGGTSAGGALRVAGLHRFVLAALIAHRFVFTISGAVSLLLAVDPAVARTEALSIHDLQLSTAEQGWKSAYDGQIVSLSGGIVTHVAGFRITLQDPTLGTAWAGLEIRAFENETPLAALHVGDRVDFHDLLVEEFRGGTIPQFKSYSSFEVISSGNPLPAPVEVPLEVLAYPPNRERCERYEGMLISVADVRVGRMDWGKADDNYELTDDEHTVWASDYVNLDLAVPPFPKYYVSRGERYRRITGIFQEYSNAAENWDYCQILPRGTADYERSEAYTIRDVQESTAADGWGSVLDGRRISLPGMVCAERSAAGRVALQDRYLGSVWSGVVVFDPGTRLGSLVLGDEIVLRQVLVTERDGMTALLFDEQSDRTAVSLGNGVVAWTAEPVNLAVGAGPGVSEPYEGMLVSLYNVTVARCGVAEGDSLYYLAAGADTLLGTDTDSGLISAGRPFFVRPGDRLGCISGIVLERALPGGRPAYVLTPRSAKDYRFVAGSNESYTTWSRLKARFR